MLRDYSSARTDFSMIKKSHIMPIVYNMLAETH